MMLLSLLIGCIGGDLVISRAETGFFIDDFVETGVGAVPPCLSSGQHDALEAHLVALTAQARGLPYPPAGDALPFFFELPGVSAGPMYTLDLASSCPAGDPGGPYCDDLVCYAPTCGAGADWSVTATNAAGSGETVTETGAVLVGVEQVVRWDAQEPVYTVDWSMRELTLDGDDWTFVGAAELDGTLSLTESFANLAELDGSYLDVEVAVEHDVGTVSIWGSAVETWDGESLELGMCSG